MAYRLSMAADDLPGAVRVCAVEQLQGAVAQIERVGEDRVDAVHEARKHLKKARALLRLARPALGTKAYRRENAELRELGRALSGARDADVLVVTAGKLAERFPGRLPADVFGELVESLTAEAARAAGDGAAGVAAVAPALRAAVERVERWPLGGAGWDEAVVGAARAYARGCDAFALARTEPTPERLHEWRKRAKDLWYHSRLLRDVWTPVMTARIEQAHALTELLGDDHDLALLAQRLRAPAPLAPAVDAEREELLALAAQRGDELREQATRLGRRLYAERPKAFRRRLARWLCAAREEQRADAAS